MVILPERDKKIYATVKSPTTMESILWSNLKSNCYFFFYLSTNNVTSFSCFKT